MHVLFVIRSLNIGGAEQQLIELVRHIDRSRFLISVATFYDGGALRPEIEGLEGVQVFSLGKRTRWDLLILAQQLRKLVHQLNPDVIHSYLDTANVICLLIGNLCRAPVVWGIRSSFVDFSDYRWTDVFVYRLGAWLSPLAAAIIVNSEAGKKYHVSNGYCSPKMYVVPNGIDTQVYYPDREAGLRVRSEWGVSVDEQLVGMVARLDAIKDHPTYLRAVSQLVRDGSQARFVCVGDGDAQYRRQLVDLAAELGISERLLWAGARRDMCAVYNALDLLVSSSYGEGFSNVVAEAMACGVPCVVTDVGDSALIVGNTGRVVPARDPQAMAEAVHSLLSALPDKRGLLGEAARQRIQSEFNSALMAQRTENILKSAALVR